MRDEGSRKLPKLGMSILHQETFRPNSILLLTQDLVTITFF